MSNRLRASGATATFLSCLVLICSAGCATKPIYITESNWVSTAPAPLTKLVTLVADTQIHESRGTASRNWSLAGDEVVDVTIRSAQQVIGAPDILAEVAQASRDALLIHLGDAMDVSCETEWARFLSTMTRVRGAPHAGNWLFLPGNHDGFLVGNLYVKGDESRLYRESYWDQVCNAGRYSLEDDGRKRRMPKETVLKQYAESLGIAQLDDGPCASNNERTICIHIDPAMPWRSFITQLVKLPQAIPGSLPIYGLLMDTSDFDAKPRLGTKGRLSPAQLKAAAEMVAGLPSNGRFFLLGHHDFNAWGAHEWQGEQRAAFERLIADPRFLNLVVTAHTHTGGWIAHRGAFQHIVELNVGSLIDGPVSYRQLGFEQAPDGAVVVHSPRHVLAPDTSHMCMDEHTLSGPGYGVEDQQSDNERLADAPVGVRKLVAGLRAIGQWFAFWQAKHKELRPHLLVYRDLVAKAMPDDAVIKYYMDGGTVQGGAEQHWRKLNKSTTVDRLQHWATCNDKKHCSIQEIGRLLNALDAYFLDAAPSSVKDLAHRYRYCSALMAADTAVKLHSASKNKTMEILVRSAPDRMQLNGNPIGIVAERSGE